MTSQRVLLQVADLESLMFPPHQKSQDFFFSDSQPHFFVSKEINIGETSLTDLNLPENQIESKPVELEEDFGFFLPFQISDNSRGAQQKHHNLLHPDNSIAPQQQTHKIEVSTISSSSQTPGKVQEEVLGQKSMKERTYKNQYDKNILSNVCSTVIRKMIIPSSQGQIRFYCRQCNVSYKEFMDYFKGFVRKSMRFGISELHSFFQKEDSKGIKTVFGLFLTRFLNEDYLSYMLSVGKMSDERKYLECAINLMYIPNLSAQQISLISQFHKLVRVV